MVDRLMEWWQKRFFRIMAYLAFGLFAFVGFLLITFPQHRVKEIISVQAESALDNRYEVTIGDMRFWRLSGVQMRGVRVRERQRANPAGAEDGPMPMAMQVERVSARVAPIRSLLNRGLTIRYQVDIGGGVIQGGFIQSGAEQRVTVRFDKLDLRQSTLVASLVGAPVFGVLDGRVELEIDGRQGIVTGGSVDIAGEQVTLSDTVIKSELIPVFTELELPMTNFGTIRVQLEIGDGEGRASRIEFKEFQTSGLSMQTQIWGHMDMIHGGGVRPRLEMRMQVSESYITENNLSFLFNAREFRTGQRGEWYGFVLSGASGNINFQGSTTAAQGPGAAREAGEEEGGEEGE